MEFKHIPLVFSFVYLTNGFLMPDILNNRTSTVTSKPLTDSHSLTDRTVQDLLTIIADEKASRHQLEGIVTALEGTLNQMADKMNLMDQFHAEVTKELLKERNNSNKLETMYRGLHEKLADLTMKYDSLEFYVNKSISSRVNETLILSNVSKNLQAMNNHYDNLFNTTMAEVKRMKRVGDNKTTTGPAIPEIVFEAHTLRDTSPSNTQTLIFTKTTLNLGSGYSNTSGQFTASHPGLYQFNTQICLSDNMYNWFKIMSNSGPLMETCLGDDGENAIVGCTSASAFAVLNPGDRVWLQSGGISSNKKLWYTADAWNSFAGALLH